MMMKTLMRPFLLAAAMLVTVGAAHAQLKVGVVDLQKVLQGTAEIKQAEADLKSRFGPKQDELAAAERELVKLQQDFEANQTKYTEAALADLSARIQSRQRIYQRNAQALQEEVNRDRQDILNRVGQRLQEIVKKVAEAQAFDMVVDAQSTLYTKPAFDISAAVTTAYDAAYPVKK
jgi:outer membrane protein